MNNSEKLRFYQHVRNISTHVINDITGYSSVTETIVFLWLTRVCPKLGTEDLEFSKKAAKHERVISFVEWLSPMPMLEAAFWISSAYALWVGEEQRKSLAMYFTPPALTTRLLDELEATGVSFANCSFFDPACGCSAFLAPIADRMKKALQAEGKSALQILQHIEAKLFGADLDQTLCLISRHFLRAVLNEEIERAAYEPELKIALANSLTDLHSMYGQMDVIVSNPPYRKLASKESSKYYDDFSEVIDGQPNLYGLFIALCIRLLKKGGVAALLTPTSFMSGQNFTSLRTWLMANATVLHIGIVSERSGVFLYVEQETALTLLKRNHLSVSIQMESEVAVVSKNGTYKSVGICMLPNSGAAWPIPRAEGDTQIIGVTGKSKFRLSDYGYTARSGAFVWNRDPRKTFFTRKEAKGVTQGVIVPLIWSSDVRADKEVRFLDRRKKNGEPAFVEMADLNHSSIIKRPAVLLQRVTSNDQPRRLIAASVPDGVFRHFGGFVGENHIVILEASSSQPKVSQQLLTRILGSTPIDRYFRCISGSTNVSLFELSQLPLPCPSQLSKALKQGFNIDDAVHYAFEKGAAQL